MKPFPHRYESQLTGSAEGYAPLTSPGLPELASAPPADFDGPGDAWSPEHLLLASVQTCFLFTLRAVARASGVEFRSLELDAEGVVDRQEGRVRFTEIVLRARLVVPPGTDHDRAEKVLEKSERGRLVPGGSALGTWRLPERASGVEQPQAVAAPAGAAIVASEPVTDSGWEEVPPRHRVLLWKGGLRVEPMD